MICPNCGTELNNEDIAHTDYDAPDTQPKSYDDRLHWGAIVSFVLAGALTALSLMQLSWGTWITALVCFSIGLFFVGVGTLIQVLLNRSQEIELSELSPDNDPAMDSKTERAFMYCANCGKQVPDDAAFCTECGAVQATIATDVGNINTKKKPSVIARVLVIASAIIAGALISFVLFPDLFYNDEYVPVGNNSNVPGIDSSPPTVESLTPITYQSILDEYSTKLREATPGLIEEYNDEADRNTSGLTGLAEICNNKVMELSEISNEGTMKMAELMYISGSGEYSEYEEWANKLMDIYLEEGEKITEAYLDSAKR